MGSQLTLNIGYFRNDDGTYREIAGLTNNVEKEVACDTTANWNAQTNYVPKKGLIVIYSDFKVSGNVKYPNLKVGDGTTKLSALPFMAVDGGSSSGGSNITDAEKAYWNGKMDKMLLKYTGSAIQKYNGDSVTFTEVYNHLMGATGFSVLVYNDLAYHPNRVDSGSIVFSATIPSNGYAKTERITWASSGGITTTYAEAEKTSSRVSAIADADKASTTKYPSVKAVVDYVEANKQEIPTVPTNVSAFTNDAGYVTQSAVSSEVTAQLNALNGNGVAY